MDRILTEKSQSQNITFIEHSKHDQKKKEREREMENRLTVARKRTGLKWSGGGHSYEDAE